MVLSQEALSTHHSSMQRVAPGPPPPAPQSQFVGWKEARVLPTGTRGWGGTSKHGYLFQKVFPAPVSPGIHSQTLGTLALKGAPR